MSNYTKSTNFATKDSLSSGDPLKILKGAEIDTEFNNIATAVATKADTASPTFTGTPTLPTGTIATTQSSTDSSTKLATTAFVQTIKNALYPVGSIYTNASVSTNPATLLGFGTWTAFGSGRVMVGLDSADTSFDTLGETGGSKNSIVVSHTHTGTTDSGDGAHNHYVPELAVTVSGGSTAVLGRDSSAYFSQYRALDTDGTHLGQHQHDFTTASTGSSGTNANLPPYIVVYMWKRTA